jgi:ADP-heptose:LPS heptosyltransferase
LSGREILVPPNLDQKNEIDRTAGLIAALDANVSAPTSVAWLSAALGVPTLKLLYNNTWTSFGKDYEPFAPQCRVITPQVCGNWPDSFAKALTALNSRWPAR